MRINYIDNDCFVIYLNKDKNKNINLESECEMEKSFRKLFLSLKQNYNININGYYDITLYKDEYYGIILQLHKDNLDYIDIYDNEVEMNINIKENTFLYMVNDYFFLNNTQYLSIYYYNNKIYIKLDKKIHLKEYLYLLEHSTIIYGEETSKIIKYGIKLEKNQKKS